MNASAQALQRNDSTQARWRPARHRRRAWGDVTRLTAMKLLVAIFLFVTVIAEGAEQSSSILSPDNKQIDPGKVEEFIAWAQPAIREYPPHFEDADHEKRIRLSTCRVTEEIKKLAPDLLEDATLLTNLGHILGMGHNLDLPTADQARLFFERALSLDQNSRRANYLYGMFLIATDRFHMDSLPYLQKAHALGEVDAQYSIGLLWYEKGDKTKALQELEAYSKAHPDSERVREVINSIKDGTLKFTRTGGG